MMYSAKLPLKSGNTISSDLPKGYPVDITKDGVVTSFGATAPTSVKMLGVLAAPLKSTDTNALVVVSGEVYINDIRKAGLADTVVSDVALYSYCSHLTLLKEEEVNL